MRAGWFTPTEASVVAVFYALVCGKFVYRTLDWKALPDILCALGAADGLGADHHRPVGGVRLDPHHRGRAADSWPSWLIAMNLSPWMFLIAVNVFLLLFGIFIEPLPGVMVLVPILAPVAAKLGVDPVHFAMIVIFNLTLGHDHAAGRRAAVRHLQRLEGPDVRAGPRAHTVPLGSCRRADHPDVRADRLDLAATGARLQVATPGANQVATPGAIR